MKISHIGVITGGAESQRSVNLNHANDIAEVLKEEYTVHFYDLSKEGDITQMIADRRAGHLDMVFNNSAGKRGGDGSVEGMLDVLGIPYVGSGMLATAIAFDKKSTKAIAAEAGIPTVKGVSITLEDYHLNPSQVVQNITTSIGYPVVVKASRGSDSVGISLVRHPRRLTTALNRAFKEDNVVLVEEFILRSAEITCMVLGNGTEAKALQPTERLYDGDLFINSDKVGRRVPQCSEAVCRDIARYAYIAHLALGCSDYSRSDFLVDKSDNIFFLELNGHAGLGKGVSTHYAAELQFGWDYPTMIKHILQLAVERYE